MKNLKFLLMLPLAFGLTASASVPVINESINIAQEEEVVIKEEDPNKDYLEQYIGYEIDHPNYNYIATYEGTKVIENAVVRVDHKLYCGDVYFYTINVSYFDDDGSHYQTVDYTLEIVVESDGTTGIIHEDKNVKYE